MLLSILIGIGIYLVGMAIGWYIKGRFFPYFDQVDAEFILGLWPLVAVLAIPVAVVLTSAKLIGMSGSYIAGIGDKQRRKKQDEVRRRNEATQAVANIEYFEDERV